MCLDDSAGDPSTEDIACVPAQELRASCRLAPSDRAGMHIAWAKGIMNAESLGANGSSRIDARKLASRAQAAISAFPSRIDAEMKRRPYATLGVACVAGLGAGVLLGSRVMRTVFAGIVTYAAVEVGRALLRQAAAGEVPSGAHDQG